MPYLKQAESANSVCLCLNINMTIKTIAFDLDNTLWDCDPLIIKGEEKFYQWLHDVYPKITRKLSADKLISHRMEFVQAQPERHFDLTTLRKDWMRHLAVDIGEVVIDNEDEFETNYIDAGFHIFWHERNNVVFYDGVMQMLENLSKKYSLGVITNGNADVNYIGIGDYFDFALSSQAAGVAKPHQDIFQQALEISGSKIENTVYVGDDPKCDVLGPQNIGMRAIWYNPRLKPWPGGKTPAAVFQHHHELEDKINKL